MNNEKMYTVSEAAIILGGSKPLSLKTLSRWRSAGIGPDYIKITNRIRYSESALTSYLERNTVKHTHE